MGSPAETGARGILRPVSDSLQPVSSTSRDLGHSAGAQVLDRLAGLGELPPGGALVTPPGRLPCDFLIHVSVMGQGEAVDQRTVEQAFLNGLRRAAALGLESVATSPLGCGARGLDAESAAVAMEKAVQTHRLASSLPARIVIAVSSDYELDVFQRAFGALLVVGAPGARGAGSFGVEGTSEGASPTHPGVRT